MLETFADLSELQQAIRAVRELCDLPIVAQMTIQVDGNTVFGATPESFTTQLDEWGADVIGLNCGVGPAIVLNAIEKMRPVTNSQAFGPTKRRPAARRAGSSVLHVFAGVHGRIFADGSSKPARDLSVAVVAQRRRISNGLPTRFVSFVRALRKLWSAQCPWRFTS